MLGLGCIISYIYILKKQIPQFLWNIQILFSGSQIMIWWSNLGLQTSLDTKVWSSRCGLEAKISKLPMSDRGRLYGWKNTGLFFYFKKICRQYDVVWSWKKVATVPSDIVCYINYILYILTHLSGNVFYKQIPCSILTGENMPMQPEMWSKKWMTIVAICNMTRDMPANDNLTWHNEIYVTCLVSVVDYVFWCINRLLQLFPKN